MTNPAAGVEVIRGKPPEDEQQRWLTAADEYFSAPKSLERIDGKAGFVLGSTALVGSVVAGLGLLGGTDGATRRHPWLAGLVALLLAVAIVLALAANLPWVWKIRNSRTDLIERFFRRSVLVRGWLVVSALVSFSLAVVLALVLGAVSIRDGPEPAVGLGWSRDGATITVTGTVTASRLSPRTEVEIVMFGMNPARAETVLARNVRNSDSTGTLTASAVAKSSTPYHGYRLSATVHPPGGAAREFTRSLSSV